MSMPAGSWYFKISYGVGPKISFNDPVRGVNLFAVVDNYSTDEAWS